MKKDLVMLFWENFHKEMTKERELMIIRECTVESYIERGLDIDKSWLEEEKMTQKAIKNNRRPLFENKKIFINYMTAVKKRLEKKNEAEKDQVKI